MLETMAELLCSVYWLPRKVLWRGPNAKIWSLKSFTHTF